MGFEEDERSWNPPASCPAPESFVLPARRASLRRIARALEVPIASLSEWLRAELVIAGDASSSTDAVEEVSLKVGA